MPNNKAGTVFGHAPRMGPPSQSPSLATTDEAALPRGATVEDQAELRNGLNWDGIESFIANAVSFPLARRDCDRSAQHAACVGWLGSFIIACQQYARLTSDRPCYGSCPLVVV